MGETPKCLQVQCRRCLAVWQGEPNPYPGDREYLECPTCGRRYFKVRLGDLQFLVDPLVGRLPEVGDYYSDRVLKIVKEVM